MDAAIPFNKPFIAGKELFYIAQAVTFGQLAGDGAFTQKCRQLLEEKFGIQRVLMTPSCTAALEMAALLCELEPDDEVILPSFTFVSTASAVVRLGARPVFVDVRPDTLNLDEDLIEAAITPATRAIFPVHYAGVACAMDRILEVARRHNLFVVEDAAQGVNAAYRGTALGSLGQLGAYSFHETKNFICGEGGALCLNTPELIERAEILRDKGTNRKQFFRGQVDKYTWVDVGSSYVPSEIVSAFLYAQLEMMDAITERRRQLYQAYRFQLADLEKAGLLKMPTVPEECSSNYHMFYIVLPTTELRNGLMAYLQQQRILAVFHYVPLHTSPIGRSYGYTDGSLPVTEELSARLLRLPFYYEMTDAEQTRVARAVRQYLEQHAEVEEPGEVLQFRLRMSA